MALAAIEQQQASWLQTTLPADDDALP